MAFKPKTTEEILNDAINYVHFNTTLTDFNIGSVIRTILEATALEDAEQYSQMLKILNSFFLKTVSGTALDDRAADFDLIRKFPSVSTGTVRFLDTQLRRSFLTNDLSEGDTTIFVEDTSLFPPTRFFIRLGEATAEEEIIAIGAVNATNKFLSVDGAAGFPFNTITFAHKKAFTAVDEIDNRGNLVCYVSGEADRIIPSGVSLRSAATNIISPVNAITIESGFHKNGYFASDLIEVVTTTLGSLSNIPSKVLNKILAAPPYGGAAVINEAEITGGVDIESDAFFKERIRNHIAGLSAATSFSIISETLKIIDDATKTRVQRTSIFENFKEGQVELYIDDGSDTFSPQPFLFESDVLAKELSANNTNIILETSTGFPVATKSTKHAVLINPAGSNPFVTQYAKLEGTILSDITPVTATTYAAGTVVQVVETVDGDTEEARKYYFLDNIPIVTTDKVLLYFTESTFGNATLLVEDKDFIVNKAVGQIEMLDVDKIPTNSKLFAIYSSYEGLIALTQKVIDGDLSDPVNFPGFRSTGVKVLVLPANRIQVNVSIDLSINTTTTDFITASFIAEQLILSYINNLNIGDDVILAEMIDRIMSVFGVTNVTINTPSGDVDIAYDHVAIAGEITIT